MNYLINLYNQIGAGPRNISLNLIEELRKACADGREFFVIVPDYGEYQRLESSPGLSLIKLPHYESLWMKGAFRLYLEYVKLPQLVRQHRIVSVLAFGNYLVSPVEVRKTVLLHHPYIFDDRQLARLGFAARSVERLKRKIFELTLRNVDNVVVQSEYVLEQLRAKWPWYRGGVHVIENPVSSRLAVIDAAEAEKLIEKRAASLQSVLTLLYVSRFYPHKNHEFLLPLSRALQARGVNHRMLVTVDPNIEGAASFLKQMEESGLPIINLGEVSQDVLREHYINAHAMLFPSRSETFGNPLIEAMVFGLPVIAPSNDYAQAVLSSAGIYYAEDVVDDCVEKIQLLIGDSEKYKGRSRAAKSRSSKYYSADVWVRKYLHLLRGCSR